MAEILIDTTKHCLP